MTREEKVEKLLAHLDEQPAGRLGFRVDNGEWSVAYEFGEETPGSQMYAGASYGLGDTLSEALEVVGLEMRLWT